jgi:hypothetical protein
MRNGMYGWNPIGEQRQMGLKCAMSRAWIHSALLAGLATTFAAGVGFGGIFQNGSFENPGLGGAGFLGLNCPGIVTGWVHANNCGAGSEILTASGNYGLATLDGGQYITWGGNGGTGGTLQQTFDTTAGASYFVNYLIAIQQNTGPGQSMKVEALDGINLLNSAAADNFLFLTWTPGPTLNFTASSTSTTLRFTDTTSLANSSAANWGLDAVTVQSNQSGVPEPGSAFLLGAGLAALLLASRFRKNGNTATYLNRSSL